MKTFLIVLLIIVGLIGITVLLVILLTPWMDRWAFVLLPQADNTTRLVIRTRTMMVGGLWNVVHPIAFFMERGMLLGIKSRSELH